MPGGNRVGRVYYDVDAENNVTAGLAAAEGEAQAFTRAINAMDAKLEVDADIDDLATALAETKATRQAMSSEWRKLRLDIPIKEKEIKKLKETGQNARKANGELTQMQNRFDRLAHSMERSNEQMDIYNSFLTTRKDEARRINAVVKADNAHAKSIADVTDNTKKEQFEVARLQEKYIKLATARRKADQGIKGLHSTADKARLGRIEAERNLIRDQLKMAGVAESKLKGLDHAIDNDTDRWSRWGQSIAGTRVHVGFFSTTITGLLRLLVAFGPVVLSVLASLASLISVAGAGLLGAFAAGGAALTGFGLAAVGVGIALREPIHQLGVAWKASTAYSDAVQKYGKDSTQAADKQDQLNNAIKGLPPQAQKAVKELGGMRQQFMKLGGDRIRSDFFGSFAEGIKTASALLPTFAKGSAQVFHAATQGFNDWMRGLRGAEAQNILKDIFKGAADFLPGLMAGLGNLASAFGRIAQSASHFLGGLGDGFQKWTQGIEDAVGSGDQLDDRVGRWIESMRKIGHFAQAATSALTTFFSIGVGPGGGFLDSMTRSLQRWNKEMQANPKSVREFFTQGIGLMEQLGPAVGRALMTLAHAAQVMSPFIEAAAAAFNQLFDILSSAPSWLLQAAGAVYALNKALRLLTGIRLGAGILSLFAGNLAGKAGAAGVLGRILGGTAGTAGAATATKQLALFGAEAGVTAGATAGLVGVLAAAGVGIAIVAHNLYNNKNNAEKGTIALRGFSQATAAIPALMKQNAATQGKAGDALARYNKLVAQGKGNSKAAAQAIKDYSEQQAHARKAQQDLNFEIEKQHTHMQDLQDDYKRQQTVLEDTGRTNGKTSEEYVAQQKILSDIGGQLRLATLNYNRLNAGAQQASAGILRSLQGLKQLSNRKTALKFRFDDESVVQQANSLGQKLNKLGQGQKVVKILANSDNATQAVGKLANLLNRVKDKRVKLSAQDAATPVADRLEAKIKALKDKKVRLQAQDAASATIAAVQSKIDNLRDKTVTLTVVQKTVGGVNPFHYAGGVVPAYAGGGAHDRMMEHANARAERRASLNSSRGARLNSPRYIAGEMPGATEFIITDAPQYRRSNLGYLGQAASALGATVIPAFGKGGSKKKKKKGGAGGGAAETDEVNTAAYDAAHDSLSYWSSEYDLDRRSYDTGIGGGGLTGGFDLGSLIGDLTNQIAAYDQIAAAIYGIQALKSRDPAGVTPKKAKLDKLQKRANKTDKKGNPTSAAKSAQAELDRISAAQETRKSYNQDLKSEQQDLTEELKDIPFLKQGLALDILELQNAASSNTIAGAEASNLARQTLYQQFAGNIKGGGVVSPSLSGVGLSSMSTSPALAGLGASATSGPAVGTRSASLGGSDGGVSVVQNFAAPPPDAHTWAKSVAFEIGAMG